MAGTAQGPVAPKQVAPGVARQHEHPASRQRRTRRARGAAPCPRRHRRAPRRTQAAGFSPTLTSSPSFRLRATGVALGMTLPRRKTRGRGRRCAHPPPSPPSLPDDARLPPTRAAARPPSAGPPGCGAEASPLAAQVGATISRAAPAPVRLDSPHAKGRAGRHQTQVLSLTRGGAAGDDHPRRSRGHAGEGGTWQRSSLRGHSAHGNLSPTRDVLKSATASRQRGQYALGQPFSSPLREGLCHERSVEQKRGAARTALHAIDRVAEVDLAYEPGLQTLGAVVNVEANGSP